MHVNLSSITNLYSTLNTSVQFRNRVLIRKQGGEIYVKKLYIRKLEALRTTQGLPAAHGVDGRTFGELVSALATTDPAALIAHLRGC
jgi:hypothetical protein